MSLISFIPLLIFVAVLFVRNLHAKNNARRANLLRGLGLSEIHTKKIVGFFHPYWYVPSPPSPDPCPLSDSPSSSSNAGGGGERVLWTAIAALQRTEPDIVSVVYSGDTNASKDEIIAKVKVRPSRPSCVVTHGRFKTAHPCRHGSTSRWTRVHSISYS